MRYNHLSVLWLAALLPWGVRCRAQDTLKMASLNEVSTIAIKNNPTQAVYQQQVKQAYYNYKASRSFLLPTITAGFDGTDNLHLSTTPVPGVIFGKPGETIYAQFGKHYVYQSGITANRDLFNWTDWMQMKIAKQSAELSQVQQDAYEQSLKEQVARLYYAVLIAKSALSINYQDQQLADSVLALSRQKLSEGVTDQLSVNEAAINSNTILQNAAQSQQLFDQNMENLKILLGRKPGSELQLTEVLATDTIGSAVSKVGADKSLRVSQTQADIAVLQAREQRTAFLPKISVTAFRGGQQYQDDFRLSFAGNAWNAYSYIGLNITVPLFTGFSNHFKYKSAVVQQNIAKLQYQSAADQSAINDRLLVKNQADYSQMVVASERSFRLYNQNVRLDEAKFKEGLISLDVYMKAFQDYLNAENTYLNNLSQLLSVKATFFSRQ